MSPVTPPTPSTSSSTTSSTSTTTSTSRATSSSAAAPSTPTLATSSAQSSSSLAAETASSSSAPASASASASAPASSSASSSASIATPSSSQQTSASATITPTSQLPTISSSSTAAPTTPTELDLTLSSSAPQESSSQEASKATPTSLLSTQPETRAQAASSATQQESTAKTTPTLQQDSTTFVTPRQSAPTGAAKASTFDSTPNSATNAQFSSSAGASAFYSPSPSTPQGTTTAPTLAPTETATSFAFGNSTATPVRTASASAAPTSTPATVPGNAAGASEKIVDKAPSLAGLALLFFVLWKGSRRFRNFARASAAGTGNLGVRGVNLVRQLFKLDPIALFEPYQSPPGSPPSRRQREDSPTFEETNLYGTHHENPDFNITYLQNSFGVNDEAAARNLGITTDEFARRRFGLSPEDTIRALGISEEDFHRYAESYTQQNDGDYDEALYSENPYQATAFAGGSATYETATEAGFGFESDADEFGFPEHTYAAADTQPTYLEPVRGSAVYGYGYASANPSPHHDTASAAVPSRRSASAMFGFGANLPGDVTSEGVYHLASDDSHQSKKARTSVRAGGGNLYDNPMETSDTPPPRTSVREGDRNKAARIAPGGRGRPR